MDAKRKYPIKENRRFYCRECGRIVREAEAKNNELINGRWYACPKCGVRIYLTPTRGLQRRPSR